MSTAQYNIHLEWGQLAAARAASHSDILIIVDTLSFSTTTTAAVNRDIDIFPCATFEEAATIAKKHNCECTVRRSDVPSKGRFSLSPLTITNNHNCKSIVMRSVNGASIVRAASSTPMVIIGTLVNAEVIAGYVDSYCSKVDERPQVTVIACGELVHGSEHPNDCRFAIEDYLGAGAIISYMNGRKTVEAQLCERSFAHERDNLNCILIECESGVELAESGFVEDVLFAAKLNSINAVPILVDDYICLA